jgi:hypothetical protein
MEGGNEASFDQADIDRVQAACPASGEKRIHILRTLPQLLVRELYCLAK